MTKLFAKGRVVNVFTGEVIQSDVLVENGIIVGVGDYTGVKADEVVNAEGLFICPGFIDGHIHIESSMLLPAEFARAALPHGTTAVIADPHEIANVSGKTGVEFMLRASEGLPLTFYIVLPSCVPATSFDESGAILRTADLHEFYSEERVIGLGEVMDYNGVVNRDAMLMKKISDAISHGMVVNGHAPLLSGKGLDSYISAGITDDHECSSTEEALERIRKGQRVMIRQGTAARNLDGLLPLFDEPYAGRCLLVTDDKHPADLLSNGHIDEIIRRAARAGKNPVTGIRMATLQAAEYFGLKSVGAVAPGYAADILLLDSLDDVSVAATYKNGVKVAEKGRALPLDNTKADESLIDAICHSFHMPILSPDNLRTGENGIHKCRVIRLIKDQLLTDEMVSVVDFDKNDGIDVGCDRLGIAVIERHNRTGHIGHGFISGIGLKKGAIASSVSHDSHNLIVIGTNVDDMTFAANRIREIGGGIIVVNNGAVLAELPLPYGGLMSDKAAALVAELNEDIRKNAHYLGVPEEVEPFMTMAFISLPVIPHIKITTKGLVDTDSFCLVPLIIE